MSIHPTSQSIPPEFYQALTMNGKIPVSYVAAPPKQTTASFAPSQVDSYIAMAKSQYTHSVTDTYLYQALERFSIKGKKIAVLGSTSPWYESVILAHEAIPTTISSEPIENSDTRLKIEQQVPPKSFNAIFALLCIKKIGLGNRIDPDADFAAMKTAKTWLKKDGLLYLSIPVGKDRLVWNSHRIYGEKRMKALFTGWRPTAYFGYSYEDLLKETPRLHEPVIILKPV
jgi:hypothetical protein